MLATANLSCHASGSIVLLPSGIVPNWALWGYLRRGHARDLQRHGASLYEILMAGEWRSPAFLKYLDVFALERDVVVEAHVDESDGEY